METTEKTQHQPFADLPAALVDEVIAQSAQVGDQLIEKLASFKKQRELYRQSLQEQEMIIHDSDYGYPPTPTTCGTDGSYGIERLLSVDLAAAAAVAVEGLTPPSEKRHWQQPHHSTFVVAEQHNANTATILRSVMLGRELILATQAPHDLVMIDGTLTLPIIYFNQAINSSPNIPLQSSAEFLKHLPQYLACYLEILTSPRSDKNYIALPKYSTRRELGKIMKWPETHDDRGLLTMILNPGELTKIVPLEQPEQDWHFNIPKKIRKEIENTCNSIVTQMKNIHVFHYKPYAWLPVLRIELSSSIAINRHRLATVIQGIRHQCATPSMLEPYPVYMADRTVKALAKALPTFRHISTQRVAEKHTGDIGDVFFALHGYRSETGGKSHG